LVGEFLNFEKVGVFDIKQFEQLFKERTLKKGLMIFEKNDIELIEGIPGSGYHFSVSAEDLHLTKKGDKILGYSCSCAGDIYCEHLAALMFYFQQEALGLSAKNRIHVKRNKSASAGWKKTNDEILRKRETENLYKFVKDNDNELSQAGIDSFLAEKKVIGFFDLYSMRFRILYEPYLHLKKLEQPAIDGLQEKIVTLIKKIKKTGKAKKDLCALYLAFIKEFMPVLHLRFTGNEKFLLALYFDVLEKTDALFIAGLSAKQKQDWWRVTLASIETNKNLHSETFLFMIPRFLSFTKNEQELLFLHSQLKKRKYKVPYTQELDKLLIAKLEVALKELKLFKTALPIRQGGEVELIIAKAELDFCAGKSEKAFDLLESHYENVRTGHKRYFGNYLEYLILKARKWDRKELELNYLREGFMYGLYIQPEKLERYLHLLPLKDQPAGMAELIALIRNKRQYYSFDKLVTLLTRAKRYDELVEAIRHEGNKFNLLHTTMLNKFPEYTEKQLDLYIKQLMDAFAEKRIYHSQEQLFDQSKEYIDKLPPELRQKLVKKILDKLGGQSKIHEYIWQLYNPEILEEDKN